jgi:hypothetical protein
MRFRGLVKKINAWARKYIFTFFLVFRVGVRISFQQTGTTPECEKSKQMKITKSHLLERIKYLHNVTGQKYDLSSQSSGNGRGYSVMKDGSHVMTFGHVPAVILDACISAYVKGFVEGTK